MGRRSPAGAGGRGLIGPATAGTRQTRALLTGGPAAGSLRQPGPVGRLGALELRRVAGPGRRKWGARPVEGPMMAKVSRQVARAREIRAWDLRQQGWTQQRIAGA